MSENALPRTVEIIEVGPRDGLQREDVLLPAAEKAALVRDLVATGLRRIQVTSFVHPRYVPQMADAEEVCQALTQLPQVEGVRYSGLALNLKGVERAQDAGLTAVDISVSASDAHSRRNANRSLQEALQGFDEMYRQARAYGMRVRGGIQCAFGYQSPRDVAPQQVLELAEHFLELGVDELALADSAGLANPRQMMALLRQTLALSGDVPLILHLHDTRGMGLANVLAALECGVRHFDTAVGGLGGCPFIAGATGNIATEDTVHMLQEMGIETGVDLPRLAQVARRLEERLQKERLPGKLYRLLPAAEQESRTR
ncbi:MAG TPA: hydroxymethylglutaryl-CoA lyase [Candidatus Sulfomarinibacteraceae bacterium]|nr:hydroxymethylglutaryl-CoA lyase [Candidatus Sulfomarinibacteraceae bacterium]